MDEIRKFVSIIVCALFIAMPIETAYALTINNVNADASNRYAVIHWMTDVNSTSQVSYKSNLNASAWVIKSSSQLITNHSLLISPLINNTQYIFNVTSSNANGSITQGTFNFTTIQKDVVPPFIDINLPSYVGSTSLPIVGLTEPNTQIYVYVNGNLSGSGFNMTGDDGVINLPGVHLRAGSAGTNPNTVKIVAVDPYGNRNEKTQTVTVDTNPPAITFSEPSALKDAQQKNINAFGLGQKSILIKGNSDEPATMSIEVNGVLATIPPINISSPWQATITFPSDGQYTLRFYAVDRTGGNPFDKTYSVTVDSRNLVLERTNLDDLSPSYVMQRVVKGKVNKADAKVIVFVNNKTTSDALDFIKVASSTFDIGIPGLGSSQFGSTLSSITDINFDWSKFTLTTTATQLSYTTNTNAQGEFEVPIELSSEFTMSEEEMSSLKLEAGEAWKNEVTVMVYDQVGRNVSVTKPVIYSRCGSGGFYTIGSPSISPSSIPEPILKAGFGQFSLTMPIKWSGPTDIEDVEIITQPRVVPKVVSKEERFGRYNLTLGQGLLKSGIPVSPSMGKSTTQLYALVSLNPTTHDFLSYAKPEDRKNIKNVQLELPLMVQFEYTYLRPDGTRSDPITQRKCMDVTLLIEPEITDFFNPSYLLKDAIDNLNQLVRNIDDILPSLQRTQMSVMYWCAGLIAWQFVFHNLGTKFTCNQNGVATGDIRDKLKNGQCVLNFENGKPTGCNCATAGDKQKGYETCCKSTIDSLNWQTLVMNNVCDRIFCPSIPSLPQHSKTYSDLIVSKSSSTRNTASSGITAGTPVSGVAGAATQCGINIGNFGNGDETSRCGAEFNRAWGSVLPLGTAWPAKSVYGLAYSKSTKMTDTSSGLSDVLQQGGSFIDNMCASEPPNQAKIVMSNRVSKTGVPTAFKIFKQRDENKEAGTVTTTVTVDFGEYLKQSAEDVTVDPQTGKVTPNKAKTTNPSATIATINSDTYFSPISTDLKFDSNTGACTPGNTYLACAQASTGLDNPPASGVKLPAAVLNAVRSVYSGDTVFSPTGSLISALRSGCLPAVTGYLKSYRNLAAHIVACFQAISTTGKGNSAQCQALLSEVVCDFVIDAISCIMNSLGNIGKGQAGFNPSAELKFNPFRSISQAGESISETISGRYGETGTYQALFNENALVHQVCMGAFTGDWDFEGLSDLMSEALVVPLKSTCMVFPANRRFVTSDPTKLGKPTYLYYVGGTLAAGANIQSLSLKLVCSADNSCNRYGAQSNPNGECDCQKFAQEKTYQVSTDTFNLKQGDIFDDAKYVPLAGQDYRYDKARLEYTYKDNTGKDITEKCEVSLREDGQIPSTCVWGPSGFRCQFNVGDRGTARFIEEPKVDTEKVFYPGEFITVPIKTEVVSPTGTDGEKLPVRKYAKFIVRNQNRRVVDTVIPPLDEGVNAYNSFPLTTVSSGQFGLQVADPITIERPIGDQATVSVVPGSKQALPNAEERVQYFVHFTTAEDYVCGKFNEVTESGSKVLKLISKDAPKKMASGLVECYGVQFRIVGTPQSETIGSGDDISTYKKTGFIVKYVKPATAFSSECTADPQPWEVEIQLLHSETTDAKGVLTTSDLSSVRPSNGDIVFFEGAAQKKVVPIKVVCSSLRAAETATAPVSIREFSLSPSTVKEGESFQAKMTLAATDTLPTSFEIKYGQKLLSSGAIRSANDLSQVLTVSTAELPSTAVDILLSVKYKDSKGTDQTLTQTAKITVQ